MNDRVSTFPQAPPRHTRRPPPTLEPLEPRRLLSTVTIELPAIAAGSWEQIGNRGGATFAGMGNERVYAKNGSYSLRATPLAAYFTFDTSALPAGTLTAAHLKLRSNNYQYNDPSESFGLFDVSTPSATLNATPTKSNKTVYNDLTSGTSYGNPLTIARFPNDGTQHTFTHPLSAAALQAITSTRTTPTPFSIGLAPLTNNTRYGWEGVVFLDGASNHSLVVTVEVPDAITSPAGSNASASPAIVPDTISATQAAAADDGTAEDQTITKALFSVQPIL